jgi:uncharacterized protein
MTTHDIEMRTTKQTVEVRGSPGGQPKIGGYAATFGQRSKLLPGTEATRGSLGGPFLEQVAPSFFKRSQNDGWPGVTASFNHDSNMLLGAVRSGTLRLSVDNVGLDFEIDMPECRSDITELVGRGDVGSASMQFIVFDGGDAWEYVDGPYGGMPVRTLLSGKLIECGPVTNAAYDSTSVSLRNVYGSLARYVDCPVEEVESYWRNGEVRKFFTRSDNRVHPKSSCGSSVKARHRERELQLLAWKWGTPLTRQQAAVEAMRLKTRWQKAVETYAADPDW